MLTLDQVKKALAEGATILSMGQLDETTKLHLAREVRAKRLVKFRRPFFVNAAGGIGTEKTAWVAAGCEMNDPWLRLEEWHRINGGEAGHVETF